MKERTPLPDGYQLILDADSKIKITIEEVIAAGGCCIAYKGQMHTGISYPVVIKECFPAGLAIKRDKDTKSLVLSDDAVEGVTERNFEGRKSLFKNGILSTPIIAKLNKTNDLYNSNLSNAFFGYGEANNTVYSFSQFRNGLILSDYVEKKSLSLSEIVELTISICLSIQEYHNACYIYLDCKPDNILVSLDRNGGFDANVIDFDTVVPYADSKTRNIQCTYSKGWAAPEQMDPSETVSYKTDLFSIGAVFFWMLTGAKPYEVMKDGTIDYSILDEVQSGSFDWRTKSDICSGADQKTIDLIQKIARASLAKRQSDRGYGSLGRELEEMIGDLRFLAKAATNNRTLVSFLPPKRVNRFKYNSNSTFFKGREKELETLTNMCRAPEDFYWAGICGSGGSGKSRLAYELCSRMQNLFWQVIPPTRFTSVKQIIEEIVRNPSSNTLICLDYIKQDMDSISDFIMSIIDNPYRPDYKIRIILIEREEKDIMIDDYDIKQYLYQETSEGEEFSGVLNLQPMDEMTIRSIVIDYIINQKPSAEITDDAVDLIVTTLKSVDKEYRRPLYALFIADAWISGEKLTKWDRDAALRYLLEKERKRIAEVIKDPQFALNRIEQEKYSKAIHYLYALATYLGTINPADIDEKLYEQFNIHTDDEMLVGLLREANILFIDGILEGMEPDLIGEFYCIDYFSRECEERRDTAFVKNFIDLAIDIDIHTYVRYSDQIYKDYHDIVDNASWEDVFRNIDFPAKFSFVRKNQFTGCSFIRSITFIDRIMSIQAGAFRNCEELQKIVLPSSLERIEKYAFCGCSKLIEVMPEDGTGNLPSVIEINEHAFQDCKSLENIIIPKSVKTIGKAAFYNCSSLKKIKIPPMVTMLDSWIFAGCSSLHKVDLSYTKKLKLADSCFCDCTELAVVYGWNKVTFINRDAFRNCKKLTNVWLTNAVDTINGNAFYGCTSLVRADLSKSRIKSINERLFYGCTSLTEVKLPKTIKEIMTRSFYGCKKLNGIKLYEGLENIDSYAFSGCIELTSVVLPKSVKTIKRFAFEDCKKLSSIDFNHTYKSVSEHAFMGCDSLSYSGIKNFIYKSNLEFCGFKFKRFTKDEFDFIKNYFFQESLTIPDSVLEITNDAFRPEKGEDGLFNNEILKHLIIPSSVKKVGDRTISYCTELKDIDGQYPVSLPNAESRFNPVENLVIPDDCTDISSRDFKNLREVVKSVVIPETITELPEKIFSTCTSLKRVELHDKLKHISTEAFRGCKSLEIIQFKGYEPNYIPDGVGLGDGVFSGCEKLPWLRLPGDLEQINELTFNGCKSLKNFEIPSGVKKIGACAFNYCESLESIKLPETLEFLGPRAFKGCANLENVIDLDKTSVTKITSKAFEGCYRLNSISLPAGIKIIEKEAFKDCRSLKGSKDFLPDNLEKIMYAAFRSCYSLESLRIPDGITLIKKDTFRNCSSLTEIDIPETVEAIEENAFYHCNSLLSENIKLPDNLKSIGEGAFAYCNFLTEMRLPEKLISLEKSMFMGCSCLEKIYIPEHISTIPEFCFKDCTSLRTINWPEGLKIIGEGAFRYCCSLDELDLPDSVSIIAESAFRYCDGIQTLKLPQEVSEISTAAFEGCRNLKEVSSDHLLHSLGRYAFCNCISLESFPFEMVEAAYPETAFMGCLKLEVPGIK